MKFDGASGVDATGEDDIAELLDAATEDDRAADDMSAALLNAVVGKIKNVLLEVTANDEMAADEIAGSLLELATDDDITADQTGTALVEVMTDDDRVARRNKLNSTIYFNGNRKHLRENRALSS